jgi:hypothetical protein
MDICEKIKKLFVILLDEKSSEKEKHSAKNEILILNKKIPNIAENIKLIIIQDCLNDIDRYLNNPTYNKDTILQLRTSMLNKFSCPDVQYINH